MEFIGFKAFAPPTLDTFARHWRGKVWHNLLNAMEDRDEPARAAWWLGQAQAGVSVLYDVHHPAAYHALKRYELVKKICEATAENLRHDMEFQIRRLSAIH